MTRSEILLCAVYAIIAVVALVATWSHNLAFMRQPGNQDIASWYQALYVNHAAASFTNDLLLLALVGCLFMAVEGRRLGMRFVWV
nr:DUF2834 domain-containing protein [Ardenticatenales bacterium]